jgi:hypothetical protein
VSLWFILLGPLGFCSIFSSAWRILLSERAAGIRLLATPIDRYESAAQGVVDGALFAFTKGTDPDAFLLIEARGKKDDVEWQFSFARFNRSCALRAVLKDKEVWQVDRLPSKTIGDPKQTYFNFR